MGLFNPYVLLIGDLGSNLLAAPYYVDRILSDGEVIYEDNSQKIARRDGEVLISWRRGVKTIQINGTILATANSQAAVEANIDSLKKIADLHGGKVVINYAGAYRTAIVEVNDIKITRPRDWNDYCTFVLTYKVYDPPFWLDSNLSGTLNEQTLLDVSNITDDTKTNTVTPGGTVEPKPKIRLTFAAFGDVTDIELVNTLTGQSMVMSPSPSGIAGDVFQIDTAALKVQRNAEDIAYTGVIPGFKVSQPNPIQINLASASGNVLAASQTTNNVPVVFYGSQKVAQEVNLSTAAVLTRLSLLLSKVGTPTGDITVRIETDSSGTPSGSLVSAGATFTITASQLVTQPGWITNALSLINLTVSTNYWLVVSTTGGDVDNYYQWSASATSLYAGGIARKYNGTSWTTKTGDQCFKLYKATADQTNETNEYDTHTINFGVTTDKDAGNTTANWDTVNGYGHMNGVTTAANATGAGTGTSISAGSADFNHYIGFVFVPSQSGILASITARMKKSGTDTTTAIGCSLLDVNSLTSSSSSMAGAVIANTASAHTMNDLTTSFSNVSFGFSNIPVVAGHAYWARFDCNSFSDQLILDSNVGTDNGTIAGAIFLVYAETHGNTDCYHSGAGNFTVGITYTNYTAPENLVTNALDSTNADIISVSQLANTILLSGATYQGQVSADGGSHYQSIARDGSAFASDTIPAIVASDLRFKGTLTGGTTTDAYLTSLSLYLKKGISLDATTKFAAQSFTVATTATRQRVDLYIASYGSPGDITVRIETDTAGSPSGTLANASATKTLTNASVLGTFGWVTFNFPAGFTLSTGSTYWIVVKAAATLNDSNKYLLQANNSRYANGVMKRSTNSGSTYSTFASGEDLMFKLYATSGQPSNYRLQVFNTERYE